MKLDPSGVPTDNDEPKTHSFGNFIVPENCHIKGFASAFENEKQANWSAYADASRSL